MAQADQSYPKISIITPSYNQGDYIEECIRSVIDQNYPHLEYIIIDGGSQDHTLEIIQKYQDRIDFWMSQADQGQSDAINKGLARASGEIINWLNSDDFYEPGTLHTVARVFQESKAKMVGGRCRVHKNAQEISHVTQGTDVYEHNLAKTIGWARTDQPATFYHRSALDKMGLLDTELHYLMDKDWWIKYLCHFGLDEIIKLEDILVNFRLHPDSKTVSQIGNFQLDRDSYYYALAKVYHLKEYTDFLADRVSLNLDYQIKGLPCVAPQLIAQSLNYYLLLRADELYAEGNFQASLEYLDFVKINQLTKIDQHLWKKLNFRNRYVPKSFIRFWRSIHAGDLSK